LGGVRVILTTPRWERTMPQAQIKNLLLLVSLTPLLACSDKAPATDDTQDDTQVTAPTPYGPENAWYHAPDASLVPEEPAEDQWVEGEQVPNLRFTDQNGDEVWLYQFFGQTVYLDWAAEWCGPCHYYAPYLAEFNLRNSERAVVITVILQDSAFALGDAETVARWVAEHGGEGPVLWLDAEQAARVEEPSFWPQINLIDPSLRFAQRGVNALYDDMNYDQVIRRMELAIGGSLDNEAEVCGDGFDNDLDLIADCMDPACEGSCAEGSTTGSLAPCTPDPDQLTQRVDIWQVTVTGGVATIESDNVAEATGFEHLVYVKEVGQSLEDALLVGDDEWACTWPLEDFGCARGWLTPGTWELAVLSGTGGEDADGDCVNPELGEYTLRVRGDVTFTLVQDDVERQSL
jgi:thiol-disulfide isomerase/thioredoxin